MTAPQIDALDGAGVLAAMSGCDPARFVLVMDGDDVQLHYMRARAEVTSVYALYSTEHRLTFGANFRQILEQDLDGKRLFHRMDYIGRRDVVQVQVNESLKPSAGRRPWEYRCEGSPYDRLGLLARCWLFAYFMTPHLGDSTVLLERGC